MQTLVILKTIEKVEMIKGGSINLCPFRNSNNVRIWVDGFSVNQLLFKLEMGKKAHALKNQ